MYLLAASFRIFYVHYPLLVSCGHGLSQVPVLYPTVLPVTLSTPIPLCNYRLPRPLMTDGPPRKLFVDVIILMWGFSISHMLYC